MVDNKSRDQGSKQDNGFSMVLPTGYLENGYIGKNGVLDIQYVTTFAEQIGRTFGRDKKTGVSKIRSFYDEVVSRLTDCTYGNTDWVEVRNNIALLKARATVRYTKGTASKFFLDFISKNIDLLISADTDEEFKGRLRNFKDHFEAVVCYMPKK